MTTAQLRERAKEIRVILDQPLKSKEDLLALFCLKLGFSRAERPLSPTDRLVWGEGEAARLASLGSWEVLAEHGHAGRGGFAVIYASFPKNHFHVGGQAVLVRQLRQSFPDALFVFANADSLNRGKAASVHFVHARLSGAPEKDPGFALSASSARLVLRRFRLGPGERTRTTAEQLARLTLDPRTEQSAADITGLCDLAFNKEALTQDFFKKLNQHLAALEKDLLDALGARASDADRKDAFTQAQLLLERLIFLYFAQNRGWLEQDTSWFINRFKAHRTKLTATSFYSDCLRPLFRSLAKADFPGRLEGVPFLNGGLFDEDDFESASTALPVLNQTFLALFDDLLEAYNFTVREDTPLAQEVAVDPEMLGKVFESIVLHAESAGDEYQAPDKRKATGSYYTPRIVVHFICREALRLWFASRASELADPTRAADWSSRISELFGSVEPADGRLSDQALVALRKLVSPSEATRCLARLKNLRTLDPSVGSGAFPVGLLHELVALHQIFEAAANGYKDPATASGRAWRQHTKAHYIEHALFGVDLQQQAVEICRLRLWLSLLVDYELEVDPLEEIDRPRFLAAIRQVSQLPNLEMNFRRGDSLHDHLCGRPVTLPPQASHAYAVWLQSIEKLGRELHRTTSAERKRGLRLDILRQRYALSRQILADEEKVLRDQRSGFDDLFGGSDRDRKSRDRLDARITQLVSAQAQLVRQQGEFETLLTRGSGKPTPAFYRELRRLEGGEMDGPHNFAWSIDFPHVLSGEKPKATVAGEFALAGASGQQELTAAAQPRTDAGFDLLLGNPPFVTARNEEKRELYRQRWPRVCKGKYLLICPFFELSFGLLRPGGQLGFIVSNAFAKREFGQPLVENFFPTVHLQKIVDCSGLLFPGHGTPTTIIFGKNPAGDDASSWKDSPIRNVATLPGGGDLRTAPEESPLWRSIDDHHNDGNARVLRGDEERLGFRSQFENFFLSVGDCDRARILKHPCVWSFFEWPTLDALGKSSRVRIGDFSISVGPSTITRSDGIFVQTSETLRRFQIEPQHILPFLSGDSERNWHFSMSDLVIFPYRSGYSPLDLKTTPKLRHFLTPYREIFENVGIFGKTKKEVGITWYEYTDPYPDKNSPPLFLTFPELATHFHAVLNSANRIFNQKAPALKLNSAARTEDYHLLSALLNSSTALFWMKQVCYNRGAGDDEERDRFEFAGGKVEQLPVPAPVADALGGKASALAIGLATLAEQTWARGQELPSLALKKLFEKSGEAYHAWNTALPGHAAPHALLAKSFATAPALRETLARATARREQLRAEMIARQEEMDWLCYQAYGLLPDEHPATAALPEPDLTLAREHRPFALWAEAGGDFEKASALVPRDWSAAKKHLWRARLTAIRDQEHIRRLEQPVYKRRWDEQWKVGNRWECGPAAYAAELADAFDWWLSEKAEWHLEHQAHGGPLDLEAWTGALWTDARVTAAWPVAAEALAHLDHHKALRKAEGDPPPAAKPAKADATAFAKYVRDLVKSQTVAAGIPAGADWEELAAKKKFTSAQLTAAKKIRGPLNVPRERFQIDSSDCYRQPKPL